MKKLYALKSFLFLTLFTTFLSCGPDDTQDYEQVSPVVLDLNAVPYPKLSDYNFFEGEMKNLEPVYKVIPYDLNSALFTDYAHKKRFIWMPEGVEATYTTDGESLNFPTGTVLIKNFYYDNVQPENVTKIIETRLMIKKAEGWVFANYIWNEEQTEAVYDMAGGFTNITWKQGTETKSTTYKIPAEVECFTCHKTAGHAIPIGPKPQNLNKTFNYGSVSKNQLTKWIEEGYLKNAPADIASTVNWADETQSLELRVRSYLDINCAHCHKEGAHCDYRPIRLAFNETTNPVNLGVCVQPHQPLGSATHIVRPGMPLRSMMHYRMNTNNAAERMPLLGRTVIHAEGVELISEWISSMEGTCP